MQFDLWGLYRLMLYSRRFEGEVAGLWHAGVISGEMHLGAGEEAIIAGVVAQMEADDAMALDHRGTAPMLMRGVDPVALLRELLGRPDGLCAGMGGHMHLYSPAHLAASSGIVGTSGPAGAGFSMAAQALRPGSLAVAFFGEAATNQGMLLESLNLAAVWKLPLVFVCKDDGWAILTDTTSTAAADLAGRARGFGVPALEVDGLDVEAVWEAAGEAFGRARNGGGPTFLYARCVHLEGHFLGDPLMRFRRRTFEQVRQVAAPLTGALLAQGGQGRSDRIAGLKNVLGQIWNSNRQRAAKSGDPLWLARQKLVGEPERLEALESDVQEEIKQVVEGALAPVNGGSGGQDG